MSFVVGRDTSGSVSVASGGLGLDIMPHQSQEMLLFPYDVRHGGQVITEFDLGRGEGFCPLAEELRFEEKR